MSRYQEKVTIMKRNLAWKRIKAHDSNDNRKQHFFEKTATKERKLQQKYRFGTDNSKAVMGAGTGGGGGGRGGERILDLVLRSFIWGGGGREGCGGERVLDLVLRSFIWGGEGGGGGVLDLVFAIKFIFDILPVTLS